MKKIIVLMVIISLFATALIGCGKKEAVKPGSTTKPGQNTTAAEGTENPDVTESANVEATGTPSADATITPGGNTDNGGGNNNSGDNKKPAKLPKGINGVDAVKLLLANQRLSSAKLSNKNIFAKGKAVMKNLAAIAKEGYREVDGTQYLAGNGYTWNEFKPNNNSLSYFNSLTNNIISTAQQGADMIDYAKKNLRVVNKWVREGESSNYTDYYLMVDENSETIIRRDAISVRICRRYKNELGQDVYEMFQEDNDSNYNSVGRMTYIPGLRFEMSIRIKDGNNVQEDYFTADKSKGYWETYVLGAFPDHYNVSYFVMKDDITYECYYDPAQQKSQVFKIMSDDKKADVIWLQPEDQVVTLTMHVGAFNGITGVSVSEADKGKIDNAAEKPTLTDPGVGRVHLKNGTVIKANDEFFDGKMRLAGVNIGYDADDKTSTGALIFMMRTPDKDSAIDLFKRFMSEQGITCKYDFAKLSKGSDRAEAELNSLISYYTWNNCLVSTEKGIADGIKVETARINAMKKIFTDVKNAAVISVANQAEMEANISFSPVTAGTHANLAFKNMLVTADSVTLTAEDTLLFVNKQGYKVAFALVPTSGTDKGLIHLEATSTDNSTYAGEKKFTVTSTNIELNIPVLSAGDYTMVAYIATTDGIRSSEYTTVIFDSVTAGNETEGDIKAQVTKGSDSTLKVKCVTVVDIEEVLVAQQAMTYEQFYESCMVIASKYGVADTKIEKKSGSSYVAFNQSSGTVGSGTYRIAYDVVNGTSTVTGHVYIEYHG